MCQPCLIYFYFFNIYICTKRYHGMHKYQQVIFFSNVVKSVRPTYGNKEELAPLMAKLQLNLRFMVSSRSILRNSGRECFLSIKKRFGFIYPFQYKHSGMIRSDAGVGIYIRTTMRHSKIAIDFIDPS